MCACSRPEGLAKLRSELSGAVTTSLHEFGSLDSGALRHSDAHDVKLCDVYGCARLCIVCYSFPVVKVPSRNSLPLPGVKPVSFGEREEQQAASACEF